jgi:hypothetical protein
MKERENREAGGLDRNGGSESQGRQKREKISGEVGVEVRMEYKAMQWSRRNANYQLRKWKIGEDSRKPFKKLKSKNKIEMKIVWQLADRKIVWKIV